MKDKILKCMVIISIDIYIAAMFGSAPHMNGAIILEWSKPARLQLLRTFKKNNG